MIVETAYFGSEGSWLMSTVQSIAYMAGTGSARQRLGPFRLPRFGLSHESIGRLGAFAESALAKAGE
jgi:hypothetical protein